MTTATRLTIFSCAGLMATAASPAIAQEAGLPQVRRATPTREEINPPPPTSAPAGTATIDSRTAIAQPACPFEGSALRLNLTRVAFTRPDGSPVQPEIAATLAKLATPTGDQSIRVVCDLRDQANEALRRAGWIASVQIPAQSIDTGELTLNVVTARITEVRVRGTPGPYGHLIQERIEQLKGLDPLNQRDAERALLITGDIPGLDVQLALRPAGTQPGDVIGDLTIVYRPFAVLANAQNFNSKALGRETGYVRGELYGLTGMADLTYIGLSSTADFSEQKIAQFGHIMWIDNRGTTLGGRFTYAWSKPDIGQIDLKTRTLITGFDLTTPLIRRVNTNVTLAAGFDYIDQKTRVSNADSSVPLNTDKLRIGYARVNGEWIRRRGDGLIGFSARGGLEVRTGLGILGATPKPPYVGTGVQPSRFYGDSRASVFRADLDVEARVDRIFSFAGSMRAQWTKQPLLNYEEFSLGNLTVGRGYDPGSNSGDRAIGLRGEARADLPIMDRDKGVPQLFAFYDFVALTNLDPNFTEVDRHFNSYGGGVRFTLPNKLVIEGMYAHPRDKALIIDKSPPPDRFLVSLIVKFSAGAR